jgi:HAE1 family hydrophobic/amphiphilic exporter-1
MLASTCLAVLFMPSFFAVVQRFEEWLGAFAKLSFATRLQR